MHNPINPQLLSSMDLSDAADDGGAGFQRLETPLPNGTLVYAALRMVDTGDQKVCAALPYVGRREGRPLEMRVFAEIQGGPHKGQGWYESIKLPASLQERCGVQLDERSRKACGFGARLLKRLLLAGHGMSFQTDDPQVLEHLKRVRLDAFDGRTACIQVRVYGYTNNDGERVEAMGIGDILDPTDPRCASIIQAGEILPATAAPAAPAPASSQMAPGGVYRAPEDDHVPF